MARIGLRLGPLHVSGRVGGGKQISDGSDEVFLGFLIVMGAIIAFFGFAPWAAVQAVSGGWGRTAFILGFAFIAGSLASVFWWLPGTMVGTSWGLYAIYLVGYWKLVVYLFFWVKFLHLKDGAPQVHSVDDYVLTLLFVVALVVEFAVLLGVAVVASYLLAHTLVTAICHISGREVPPRLHRSSESPSP